MTRARTIGLVCDYYRPFEIGGAERSAARLAEALVAAGHQVVVFTPNYGAASEELSDNVRVRRLWFPERLAAGQLARRRWLANPLLHLYWAAALARAGRQLSIDLLHVQHSGLLPAAAAASRLAGIPFVLTVRDLSLLPYESSAGSRSWRWRADARWASAERAARQRAAAAAGAIVFVSDGLRRTYAERGSALAARGRVVPNIAPPAVTAPAEREAGLIVFLGKLSEGKGLAVLYDALLRLLGRAREFRVVIAGDRGVGYVDPPAALRPLVQLTGRLPHDQATALLARGAIFVSPSIWPEPLSRSLLEAMAAGIAIVATDVGGSAEAVEHRQSALLVPPTDPAALAAALEELLGSPDLRQRLGANAALGVAQRFSSEAVIPLLLSAYDEAAA